MKKLVIFFISILTSFVIYSERVLKEMVILYGSVKNFDIESITEFSYTNINFILITGLAIALIIFYSKFNNVKKKRAYNILSAIFSLLLVLGFSYSVIGNHTLVTGNLLLTFISILKFITYYIFLSTILNLFAIKLKNINLDKIKLNGKIKKFRDYYELHPYKTTIIILLIAWLPYIISFYPAILSPDPSNQIKQYYGDRTHYVEGVKLIDENVLITNHHPVFHTFILGGFTKLGKMLGSFNFGLFLFSSFQIFIVISALTYLLVYLKKLQLPFIYRFITLILFALIPVFPLYALSPVKDTLFGALLIFLIIEMHKLMTTKYTWKEYISLGLLLLIMMLIRNNGVYILLFSMITLSIITPKRRVAILIVVLISFAGYQLHNKILLPTMHISEGSIREMLSVPLQQTARLAKYHPETFREKDIEIVDKILGYDTLATRYKPNIADPVKYEFNKETTSEDLKEYFKTWAYGLVKHPLTYINATINTTYGYFYPNTSNWYVYHNYDKRLKSYGYHFNKLELPRDILSGYALAYPYIPIVGSQVNIGFNIWLLMYMITYLVVENKKRFIVLLLPSLVLLLTCVVGPVNTYFRYMFPIVISMPLVIGIIAKETNIFKKS